MLGTLERAVEEIVAGDVANLCDSEIRERFVATRRTMDRLDAHLAELLTAVHHRKLALGDGAVSSAAWVQGQTGQRIADARLSLAMGLACESLPVTKKAWHQGEISTSLAATICRGRKVGHEAVYADVEESLVEFAAKRD